MAARVVFDIEPDGLSPTKVHCFSASGGIHGTTPEEFQQNIVDSGATLVAHNGIGFDYRVLGDLWGIDFRPNDLVDSLVLSRLAQPDRQGGHKLEEWGERLGYPKPQHEDWSTYSPAMAKRCDADVRITERLMDVLDQELLGFSQESIDLEHQVARIIEQQRRNGWEFDEVNAFRLIAELSDKIGQLEKGIYNRFKPIWVSGGEVTPKKKQDGSLSKVGLNCLGDAWHTAGGPFSKLLEERFNIGSRQQIAKRLQKLGWVPTVFTPTGQPQVDEGALKDVDIPEAQMILDWLTLGKTRTMVQSWVDAQEDDGRIRGFVNSCGAVTGRMTHSSPNVAQVIAKGDYGPKARACWTVKPGYKLVGVDADALELVCLAHYMKDPDFIEAVSKGDKAKGTDVHTMNQNKVGLGTRDLAKTFIYAFIYGAGDLLIADIVGSTDPNVGKRLKAKFLRETPALADLIKNVKDVARSRGWIKGLDGRRVFIRHIFAALNTLLQSAGAIIMKKALVLLDQSATEAGLDYAFVGNIHDESQTEVREDQAAAFGALAEKAIKEAAEHFNLRCPLGGTHAIGDNWAQTH